MKQFRLPVVLIAIGSLVAACGGPGATPQPTRADGSPAAGDGGTAEWPDELVLGLVPSREADVLIESAEPLTQALAERLSEEAGKEITVEGFVPQDYTGLVEAMRAGQADIGAFGPFALLQSQIQAGADIILQSVRDGKVTYHTQWFTNNPDKYCSDEPVEDDNGFLRCNGTDVPDGPAGEEALSEVSGSTVAFVGEDSASGYIFPAVQLLAAGIDPRTDDDITRVFAGGHDAAVLAVYNEDAEVGVSFDDARILVAEQNPDVGERVVVFALSPEIPNDGISVRGDLPEDLKEAIKNSLLEYSQTEEGSEVLNEIYEISELAEADLDALEIVREAASQLGITTD
jgi:phosphonate transport system substrate-binding protein